MRKANFIRCCTLAIVILTPPGTSVAQVAETQQAVHVELFGSGILPTVNYERSFNPNWFGRAGFSFATTEGDTSGWVVMVFPLTVIVREEALVEASSRVRYGSDVRPR